MAVSGHRKEVFLEMSDMAPVKKKRYDMVWAWLRKECKRGQMLSTSRDGCELPQKVIVDLGYRSNWTELLLR